MQTKIRQGAFFTLRAFKIRPPPPLTFTDKTCCLGKNTASAFFEHPSCSTASNTGGFYEEWPCLPRLSRAFRSREPSFAWVIAWHRSLAHHRDEPTLSGEDRCQTTGFYINSIWLEYFYCVQNITNGRYFWHARCGFQVKIRVEFHQKDWAVARMCGRRRLVRVFGEQWIFHSV